MSFSISEDLLLPVSRQDTVSGLWWPVMRLGIEGQNIVIVNLAALKEQWVPTVTNTAVYGETREEEQSCDLVNLCKLSTQVSVFRFRMKSWKISHASTVRRAVSQLPRLIHITSLLWPCQPADAVNCFVG